MRRMPLCVVRYRIPVSQASLGVRGPGVLDVIAEEERAPDEWGEPGAVVRRRWLIATDWEGRDHVDSLNSGRFRPSGKLDPIGPVVWADGYDGEVGA